MDNNTKRAIAEGKAAEKAAREKKYRRAKIWQMGFFAANNTATNLFMFLMFNVAYFATGVVGLGTVIVSTLITGSRMLDGFTDPIIGLLIDKTDGKFGKFRPSMLLGYVTMALTIGLMFFTNQHAPEQMKLIYFALLYVIYIIGYTFQTAVTKSGQSVLTTDPSQRPLFATFDISFTALFFAGAQTYLSSYLVPKYGGMNVEGLFHEFAFTFIVFSGILTSLAIIGIWSSDISENFGTGQVSKITFKDMVTILKGNRALKTLIVAASTDKLGQQIATNSIVMIIIFGVIIGDFSLYGTLAGILMVPNILIVLYGTRYASKVGTRKGYIRATLAAMCAFGLMFLILSLGDPTTIRLGNWNFMSIAFFITYIVGNAVRTLSGGLVIPMIPDVTDYETYLTGRYAPGVMGTIFSFVDKMISSLAQTLIGVTLAWVGFRDVFPDVNTPYTSALFRAGTFLFIGTLLIAWTIALISIKFYPLTKEKMEEVQKTLTNRRRLHLENEEGRVN